MVYPVAVLIAACWRRVRRDGVAMPLLTGRYAAQIAGVVSCYDRLVIMGTLPGICYAAGMARHVCLQGIRLLDYPRFAQALRDEVRGRAEQVAAAAGLSIEFIRATSAFRKEERIHTLMAHAVATGRKSSLPVLNKVPAVRDPAAVKARVEGAYKWDGPAPLPHSEEMMALASAGIFALHYPDRPITAALRQAAAALVGRDGGGSP
jgi:hypothetical protein